MTLFEKHFEIESSCDQLKSLRDEIAGYLGDAGFDEKSSGELLLAMQEALTNVIRHAYRGKDGRIGLDYKADEREVTLDIRDFGPPFDLTKVPDPVLPKEEPGGLGIYLIKKLVDRVSYSSCPQKGNLLSLTKLNKTR